MLETLSSTRALKSNLDVIKCYFETYLFFKENVGKTTEHGVLITQRVVDLTLKRLLKLMEKEWRGKFEIKTIQTKQ